MQSTSQDYMSWDWKTVVDGVGGEVVGCAPWSSRVCVIQGMDAGVYEWHHGRKREACDKRRHPPTEGSRIALIADAPGAMRSGEASLLLQHLSCVGNTGCTRRLAASTGFKDRNAELAEQAETTHKPKPRPAPFSCPTVVNQPSAETRNTKASSLMTQRPDKTREANATSERAELFDATVAAALLTARTQPWSGSAQGTEAGGGKPEFAALSTCRNTAV
ncbi:hypothetical protein PSPO01_13907 [Paraphaeosphaeria sporulosa]